MGKIFGYFPFTADLRGEIIGKKNDVLEDIMVFLGFVQYRLFLSKFGQI